MKIVKTICFVMVVSGALAGCRHDDSGNVVFAQPQSFTSFVKQLFGNTDDTSDPVKINNRQFRFTDRDNESAYDDLLAE